MPTHYLTDSGLYDRPGVPPLGIGIGTLLVWDSVVGFGVGTFLVWDLGLGSGEFWSPMERALYHAGDPAPWT